MDVVVQPSVPWMSLNDQIKGSGLFFPVDPGPSVSPSHSVGQEKRGRKAEQRPGITIFRAISKL
jgi:D-lactate dehydrogenase (cytochrome)